MSNTKNLANLAAALDDGTSGQVLQSTGSGGVQFADSTGSGVTVHANQAAMLTDAASASEGSLHYETGTNKLYVKQSSGFYLLASITNVAPTIDSFSENTGGAGANDLTNATPPNTFTLTSGSNTVITINATEPDLETISYSATVTSGTATNVFSSPSFPVTNQSSNVFTLTPVTSGGGTVTIRFDASDGTNVANVSHSFEISFTITDSHYTSLLMATDGSAGDNNDITDSSSNNHTITVTGDAHAGTFSPYRHGGYSASFDGGSTADAITYGAGIVSYNGSSAFNVGTNDYSVECWIKAESYSTNTACRIFDFNDGTTLGNIELRQSSNTGNLQVAENGSYIITSSNSTPMDGDWHFIQLIRTGGTTTLYIDGTSRGSASSSTNINSISYITVGARNQYSYGFDGQIADFRFSNTARTAGTPTERLTSDSNTKLLVCTKPYLVDESDTATSISLYSHANRDDPKLVAIGPYDYAEYSESDNGGSVYFDGTGDYLTAGSSGIINFGTGDFTVEFFINTTAGTGASGVNILNPSTSTGSGYWAVLLQNGKLRWNNSYNVSNLWEVDVSNELDGSWHHMSIVRSSGTFSVYVDGTSKSAATGTFTDSTNYSGDEAVRIGEGNANDFTGYLSDVRIVKGTAVYSGAFAPPTGPLTTTGGTYPSTTNVDTSITASNTKLLLSGTDANVLDKSQGNNLKLLGNTAASTTQAKFSNTASVYFDGTGDYIEVSDLPDLGADDWTIEFWARWTDFNASRGICQLGKADGSLAIMSLTTGKIRLLASSVASVFDSDTTLSTGTWYHIAYVNNGSADTQTLYINGSADANSGTRSTAFTYTDTTTIIGGRWYTSAFQLPFSGYIQDLRITAGKARYTSNFTVPSAPLKG